MELFRIGGGRRISGQTRVGAAKNAVLPILAACLLTEDEITLEDCPGIADVDNMAAILRSMGGSCAREGGKMRVCCADAVRPELPEALSKKLRSSIFLLGPMLGRFRRATATYPGGCEIGQRPIDLHLSGLRALGARITESHGMIYCDGSELKGGDVALDFPSVGATENVMMAATLAEGVTTLHNAAREPEIVDLQAFLRAMGAKIEGAGTDTIRVAGVKRLNGARFTPMPDRIVAGTLLIAAAMTGGAVELTDARASDLTSLLIKLKRGGCRIEARETGITLRAPDRVLSQDVATQPYPGFPTDLQAQWMALSAVSRGTSVIVENLFENRFSHAAELRRMGADIRVENRTAVAVGGRLVGARVRARDLRGGAALTLAGLAAEDYTEVEGVELIDRGYEKLDETLRALGADIRRVTEA